MSKLKKMRVKTFTDDLHYSDKGSHGARHDFMSVCKTLQKLSKKDQVADRIVLSKPYL